MWIVIEMTLVALVWGILACVGLLLGNCQTGRNNDVALLLFGHGEELSKIIDDGYK